MSIRQSWRRCQFRPGLIGFFVNPYYLMRRHLWRTLSFEAASLSGKILDVGCGAKPYRSLFSASEYVGMDVAVSGHDHADENIDVFYDGSIFPFPEASFDVVFMSEVLEHVPDAALTLSECRRVLRANGVLLLTMPFLWGEHEMPYDHRRLTTVGLDDLVVKTGFSIVTHRRLGGVLETVAQLAGDAITRRIAPRSKYLRAIRNLFVAPWINFFGTLARWLGPADRGFFLGHVVLARRDATLRSSLPVETALP